MPIFLCKTGSIFEVQDASKQVHVSSGGEGWNKREAEGVRVKEERRSGNKIIRVLDLKVSSTFFFSPAVKRGPILGFVLDPLVSLVLSIAQDVELAGGKGLV